MSKVNGISQTRNQGIVKGILKTRSRAASLHSDKKSYHIEIDFSTECLYQPGDTIAIDVINSESAVHHWIKKFQRKEDEFVEHRKTKELIPLFTYLQTYVNLASVLEGDLSKARPLTPRFYSIASSPLLYPNEIHLLVAVVEFPLDDRVEMGVGSSYLTKTLNVNDELTFKLYPNIAFRLPSNDAPIIMVGPGTGVAPFRAFLQERVHQGSKGKNWLFFGERHENLDFYYQSFFESLVEKGHLRLNTAFSRDQKDKIYVQHRMEEQGKELFDWLEEGAYFYLCGDAKRMAKDVQHTFHSILQTQGKMTPEEASAYTKALKLSHRFKTDVY